MERNDFYYEMTIESLDSVTLEKLFEVIHALVVPHQKHPVFEIKYRSIQWNNQ